MTDKPIDETLLREMDKDSEARKKGEGETRSYEDLHPELYADELWKRRS